MNPQVTAFLAEPSRNFNQQLLAVFTIMKDGNWHTLTEISKAIGAPPQSVSARLRQLRNTESGGYTVLREYTGNGIFRYRLVE